MMSILVFWVWRHAQLLVDISVLKELTATIFRAGGEAFVPPKRRYLPTSSQGVTIDARTWDLV